MGSFKISIDVKENGRKPPNWSLQGDLDGEQTLASLLSFTKKSLIGIATDVLREEQGKGFDKDPITLVDGKYNKPVEDVHPLGKIQYVARQDIKDVIYYAYKAVYERSPVLTGEYLHSNVVLHNGVVVATTLPALEKWLLKTTFNAQDKIRILNTAPYARKLELEGVRADSTRVKWGKASAYSKGSKNGKGQVRKPNGAYTLAEKAIKAKYGRNAFIKFELMSGSSINMKAITAATGDRSWKPPGQPYKRERQTGRDKGKPYVYPSILIYAFDVSRQGQGVFS